jgi:catechol 2,3-dioxygenase-like lactoylglutathione lyase family enzyme
MRILGLVFAGTATDRRPEMVRFLHETLGLEQVRIGGVEADMFELPNGTRFAVADPRGMGDTSRSVGFLVESLDEAVTELQAAGVEVGDEAGENDLQRYVHFRAPDGKLYELIEERAEAGGES